jgi:putative ABC transport system permease protein
VDATFMGRTTYAFSAMAHGYDSPRAVWDAMAADPTLAVVDSFVAPRRDQWGFAVKPAFQLSGFYLEEGAFEPVPVDVRDPFTGTALHLKVIAVLNDNVPLGMAGITLSQAALAPLGERALPTIHHLAAAPGVSPSALADKVEAALLARGAEAQTYREVLDDAVGSSMLFIRLIQGFMALGLLVGVAALGVITARAVVERRQQIGVLRAVGFQPEMVRRTLLAETSMIAVTAIGAGSLLGLVMSYNVIADSRQQLGYGGIRFAVPWLDLALIFAAVVVAALAATSVSAFRAARIYPAEALRYQ